MNARLKTTEKILLTTAFFLLPFSGALAYDDTSVHADNDIYKYNALENKASFREMLGDSDVLEGKSFEVVDLPVDVVKELENITKKQNISVERISVTMKTIKGRNVLRTFFIGNNLGTLRFQLVQIEDQIYLLETLAPKTNDVITQNQINSQIKSLTEEKAKIEDFILEQDGKFNLFGWLITSF